MAFWTASRVRLVNAFVSTMEQSLSYGDNNAHMQLLEDLDGIRKRMNEVGRSGAAYRKRRRSSLIRRRLSEEEISHAKRAARVMCN